ncbi:MAG: hypothetical protein AAB686_03215 [Patescibacteria group bacterium]
MRRLFIIAAVTVFLLPLSLTAHAASNFCDLQESFQALKDLGVNPPGDYFESVRAELNLRKTMLGKTLDCATEEAESLKEEIRNLPESDPDVAELKSFFLGRLADVFAYYDQQKSKIGDLVSLQNTKNTAQDILLWRQSTWEPLVADSQNIILWNKNQTLFRTAENRFNQISQTVRLLKLLEQEDVRRYFDDSEKNLRQAQNLHLGAKRMIKYYRPAGEVTETIKNSLDTLAKTYQKFFGLSQEVKKFLPL